MHWLPFLVLAAYLLVIWLPYMRCKDRSLSRHPGFEDYRRRTAFWIPFLF